MKKCILGLGLAKRHLERHSFRLCEEELGKTLSSVLFDFDFVKGNSIRLRERALGKTLWKGTPYHHLQQFQHLCNIPCTLTSPTTHSFLLPLTSATLFTSWPSHWTLKKKSPLTPSLLQLSWWFFCLFFFFFLFTYDYWVAKCKSNTKFKTLLELYLCGFLNFFSFSFLFASRFGVEDMGMNRMRVKFFYASTDVNEEYESRDQLLV